MCKHLHVASLMAGGPAVPNTACTWGCLNVVCIKV
jgi:hypothetical protein